MATGIHLIRGHIVRYFYIFFLDPVVAYFYLCIIARAANSFISHARTRTHATHTQTHTHAHTHHHLSPLHYLSIVSTPDSCGDTDHFDTFDQIARTHQCVITNLYTLNNQLTVVILCDNIYIYIIIPDEFECFSFSFFLFFFSS